MVIIFNGEEKKENGFESKMIELYSDSLQMATPARKKRSVSIADGLLPPRSIGLVQYVLNWYNIIVSQN